MKALIIAFTVLLAGCAVGLKEVSEQPTSEFDLIIRNGTVFDGSGGSGRRADVGIRGERIMAVGDLRGRSGTVEKDASGLYVSPGFISVHDHSAPSNYSAPVNLLTQGITTAITNPDGGGPIDFVSQISMPVGLNYGAYIGFNSIWGQVVGLDDRRATPAEIVQMRDLVNDGMAAGAFGLSAGLDYKPGFWADTDEVVAVAEAAALWRTGFTNHERVFPGNGYSSMAGMEETLEIGEQAGVMPIITHMKLQGHDQGKAEAALALATDAAKRGVAVGMDAYPYTFGSTSLAQLTIPAWAQDGGNDAMLARFKDPVLRKKIDAETNDQLDKRWGGAAGVYLSEMRRELTDIIAEMGGVSPGEAIMRLLEAGQRRVLLRFGTEEDQEALVSHPLTAVSCDCGATASLKGHPRNWGAYPKFLGRYVREKKLVGWGEAVRKMTALPATMIGLVERGFLLPGMIADITIFDPATVVDNATMSEPAIPSTGIMTVIINGQVALDNAMVAAVPAGKPLFRSQHEPARPMNFEVNRTVVANGRVNGSKVTVAVELSQAAGTQRPQGSVFISGLDEGGAIEISPSVLQTTEGWASMTGIARWNDGTRKAITLILEQADPFAQQRSTVTLLVDGVVQVEGILPGRSVLVGLE